MSSPPPSSQVLSVAFITALFYGLYLSTFFHCMRWTLFTSEGWELRPRRTVQWTMCSISVAIFVMSTVDRGVQLKLWLAQLRGEGEPEWISVLLCTTGNMTSLLVDAVLIFRLWRIYFACWRVALLPVLLWIGNVALTIVQAYAQIRHASHLHVSVPINASVGPGIILTPFWASGIVLNVYASCMIIRELWRIREENALSQSSKKIKFALSLIIESGSLYLTVGIAHFVVWWTPNDFAINVVSNMNIPVIGMAFNLIIIRIAKYRAEEDNSLTIEHLSDMQFQSQEKLGHTDVENVNPDHEKHSRDDSTSTTQVSTDDRYSFSHTDEERRSVQ